MSLRIAINGFGRIGRLALRAAFENGMLANQSIEIVAINDLAAPDMNALLLQNDSIHGRFPSLVQQSGNQLDVGFGPIQILQESDPSHLPWAALDIDLVMECTGRFTNKEAAFAHIKAGAKRVLVSAPCTEADATIVYGVNDGTLSSTDQIISNASCTTNCLSPVAKALNDTIGIEKGFMTTIHAFTGDQNLQDGPHKDPRRARAALGAMIPTTTGAARAVGLVLPELEGKLDGTSIRVPTPNVSMVDLTFTATHKTSVTEVNSILCKAAAGSLADILTILDRPLVSIDLNHDPSSAIADLSGTTVMDGNLVRVMAWYDNEWGFSNRMCDTALAIGRLDQDALKPAA